MPNNRLSVLIDAAPSKVQNAFRSSGELKNVRLETVQNVQWDVQRSVHLVGDGISKLQAMRAARDRGRYFPIGRDPSKFSPLLAGSIGSILEHNIPLPLARPKIYDLPGLWRYLKLGSQIHKNIDQFPEYRQGMDLLAVLRERDFNFTAFISTHPSFSYHLLCESFLNTDGHYSSRAPVPTPLVFSGLVPW